MKTGGGF
jgi:hypothetical protein